MSIITAVPPQPLSTPPIQSGHRRAARMMFRRKILLYPCDNPAEGKTVATLYDFSPRGIGFLHTRRMDPGSQFIVRLMEAGGRPVPLLYTVRHCRTLRRKEYRIGAELTRVLGARAVDEASAPYIQGRSDSASPRPAVPIRQQAAPTPATAIHASTATPPADGCTIVQSSGPLPEETRSSGFDASAARGFVRNRTATLVGHTLIGWDRVMDLRLDGNRIWVHLHPPDRDSGWGMFIDVEQLRQTIEQLCTAAPVVRIKSAA